MFRFYLEKQDGVGNVIVITLMLMSLATIIGLGSMDTTLIEQQISSNDQLQNRTLYDADAGVFSTAKLISRVVNEGGPVTTNISGVTYLAGSNDPGATALAGVFFLEVLGYEGTLGRSRHDLDDDLSIALGTDTIGVDMRRIRSFTPKGGGVEFASGAEGIGSGSTGGVAIMYGEIATGNGPRNSATTVLAEFRKVVNTPGGI